MSEILSTVRSVWRRSTKQPPREHANGHPTCDICADFLFRVVSVSGCNAAEVLMRPTKYKASAAPGPGGQQPAAPKRKTTNILFMVSVGLLSTYKAINKVCTSTKECSYRT